MIAELKKTFLEGCDPENFDSLNASDSGWDLQGFPSRKTCFESKSKKTCF